MKVCRQCKADTDESLFYSDRSRPDHLSDVCIACDKERRKRYAPPIGSIRRKFTPEMWQIWLDRLNDSTHVDHLAAGISQFRKMLAKER